MWSYYLDLPTIWLHADKEILDKELLIVLSYFQPFQVSKDWWISNWLILFGSNNMMKRIYGDGCMMHWMCSWPWASFWRTKRTSNGRVFLLPALMMFKNWRWTSPFFWHGFNFVLNLWAERTWTWKTMDNDCQVFTPSNTRWCFMYFCNFSLQAEGMRVRGRIERKAAYLHELQAQVPTCFVMTKFEELSIAWSLWSVSTEQPPSLLWVLWFVEV